MRRIDEKEILRRLELLSQIKPTAEASGRAMERVRKTLANTAEQQSSNVTTWRTIMKSRITKLAAAVILIAVVIGIYQGGGGIESVALGEVFENMKKMPWMHQVSTGFERGVVGKAEQWFSFESNVWISKTYDGAVKYWDLERNKRHEYDPASNTITVSRLNRSDFPLNLSSPCSLLESLTEKLTEQGAEIITKSGKYKGKVVAVKEISLTQNNISNKCRLFIDRKRHVLLGAEIKGTDQVGNIVMDGNIEFEYPESGPKDIYALGVPTTANVVVEGAESDVELAAELKQVEVMFAARDVDRLVAMLSDAQFEQSKVLAANYLAKIGDSRAIEPLEKLSAEWSGDEQENPYAAAIREIKERLEQETTEIVVESGKDLIKEKVVKVPVQGPEIVGSGSKYDHFLFIRLNKRDGEGGSKTGVLARITPKGFEFRDINTQPVSRRPWERPLCVVGGRLYAKHGEGELSGINLATGQTEVLSSDDDESVYSLLNVYGGHSYVYDDGRLYGQAGKDEDAMTLRVLDLRAHAYRDITALEHELEYTPLAVSPDHKQLAYFAEDPNGCLLTVVDVDSGEVMYPSEPIRFIIPGESSLSWYAPPLFWVDTNRVVCIRTEVWSRDMDDAMNKVAVIDVSSGEMEDIVALPGNPYGSFIRMTQRNEHAGLRIWIDRFGKFSIDLAERKLIEDETVNGNYLVADGYLFHGEQELGPVQWDGRKDMEVSPDGKRAIWVSEGKLFYHDSAGETVVPVIEDGNAVGGLLWFKAEDLQAPAVASDIPAGWTAFKDRPPAAKDDDDDDARRRRWRDRRDIKDHLTLTVETDKDTYLLHEPVEVTLTFTSTTDANIEVASSRIIRLDMDYNGGSKDIECPVGPYETNVETIVLGPGESISATDTLEVALVGDYQIRCEYGRFEDPWRGEVEDDVAFKVNPVSSPDEEHQLFEAKFTRLIARFHRELSTEYYDWSWFNAMVRDEITGMAGMGPTVLPYITEAIKEEENEDVREWLYRVLTPLAGAKYLPFFQDRLAQGEAEPACEWLYDLYQKGQDGSSEALASLLSAMNHKAASVRRKAAGELADIYDPNVKVLFEAAIEDDDEQVRTTAARYLAAAEWLDLDQWLDVAAKEPTAARYLATRSIIKDLEAKWNITKGPLPDVTWEEASKNPEKLEQYRKVVRAWQKWASENVRFSSQFFDREHEDWLNRR